MNLSHDQIVAGQAEWRRDAPPLNHLELREIVQSASADDAQHTCGLSSRMASPAITGAFGVTA
jgi:hypothetical protein